MRSIYKILIISLLLSSLTSCFNAALTSAQVIYDRNKIQKNLNDHYITWQANRKIYGETNRFKDSHISVATFNGIVLLAGQIPDPGKRKELETIVKEIPDVEQVYNLTTLSDASSALTQLSDTWITTKVKSKFIASTEIEPDQIKVVTENGTVYLMGTVLPEQAEAAVELARTTDGVQNVVKIFSYLRITKK